jgi:hypothetical protein
MPKSGQRGPDRKPRGPRVQSDESKRAAAEQAARTRAEREAAQRKREQGK